MDVKGILGLVPGIGIPVLVGTILTRPDRQPNLLARNRFMIHTFRPIDSDPRGSSIARAAFTPWNLKQQLWGEFLKWLTQFASPSIIGVLSENATPDVMRDSNGNVILGPDGKPVTIEPADLLATALASLKNSTALALAPGTEVTPIEMRGQGAPFITAFRFLSEQIATAILHQTLTTQSAKYGTKAQASVHQDVLMTLIRQAKASLIGCIRRDLLRNWIRWNWGEYPADYLIPRVSLGYTEQQDFATELTAISGAYSTGFLDDSQKPGLDRRLQLPTRRPLSEEEIAQQRMGQGDTVPIPGQPIPAIDPLNKAMQKVSGVAVPKPTAAPPPPPAQRRAA
jgi:hypothetical protein